MDKFWYLVAMELFADKNYISTALLQRYLKITYYQASLILNKLVSEGFCEEQVGAMPCRIIKLAN